MNFDATAIIYASIISTCKYRKKEDTNINSLTISNFPNCLEATIYACAMIVSAKLKIEKENCIEEKMDLNDVVSHSPSLIYVENEQLKSSNTKCTLC